MTISSVTPPGTGIDYFAGYSGGSGRRLDQLVSAAGPRELWQPLTAFFRSLDVDGLNRAIASVTDSIRDSDVTLGDALGKRERQWRLSAMPTMIDADAWRVLETGIRDRSEILELILDDLLGARRLIREGIIPPGLLWQNPIFHRAYVDLPPPGPIGSSRSRRIDLMAMEVARTGPLQWTVLGDRTRAPSGLGYLLENRIATSGALGQTMRDSGTQRLAGFFETLRNHLAGLSTSSSTPRIALLTPRSESYRQFEDAFLVRYLGFTLAQGTDLAVRGDRLFLKTIGGLAPIDVLWRHVNDRHCDPLSLNPRSIDGVPGLLRTIRHRHVAIANSIGSGLVQTPALFPYIDAATKFLIGRSPLLPTNPTWWCGDVKSRQYVLDNLRNLVIKAAFRTSRRPTAFPNRMTPEEIEKLAAEIRRNPHRFVATAMPNFPTTPVFQNGRACPWRMVMKCFALQHDDTIDVLPGALVRLSPEDHELMFSAISGSLTQDCWVQTETASASEPVVTLLPPKSSIPAITRFGDELPSRVAEQLYWLARYAERAESIARLIRTLLIRLNDATEIADLPESRALIRALAALGQIEPVYALDGMDRSMPEVDRAIVDSLVRPKPDDGLHRSLQAALEAARSVRDRLPIDAFRVLSRMVRMSKSICDLPAEAKTTANEHPATKHGVTATPPPTDSSAEPKVSIAPRGFPPGRIASLVDTLNRIIDDLLSFVGMMGENFVRSGAWPFLQLGRSIERAAQTSELILATFVRDPQTAALPPPQARARTIEAVLEIADSLMTHRARYPGTMHVVTALDLLVTDETNPRSIAFQFNRIESLLQDLIEPGDDDLPADLRWVRELLRRLAETELIRISYPDGIGTASTELSPEQAHRQQTVLVDLISGLISDLPWLDRAIAGLHLLHTDVYVTGTGRIDEDLVVQTDDLNETPEPSWIDITDGPSERNLVGQSLLPQNESPSATSPLIPGAGSAVHPGGAPESDAR